MDTFQKFIAISRYARWIESENRRESWEETVDRWWNYFTNKEPSLLERPDIKTAILNREVLPSMRGLMVAGPALDRDHTALYNCAYIEIDSSESFSQLMYVLMCGTGMGFTVERRCTEKLPIIPTIEKNWNVNIDVQDSREGWCDALYNLISFLYNGIHPKWTTDRVRPAGARLKTFGGRASGPAPLEEVFRFIVQTFYKAQGRRLTPLECHDICCKIAQSVIVGGVRRSAMISLSDLGDREMALCKSGAWWDGAGHRSLANNSAVYTSKPSLGQFLEEWTDLYNSHSGERGMLNRQTMTLLAERAGRETKDIYFGTNPCSEIILRPNQFCNLSTIVVKDYDTEETLMAKIEVATIIGTIQSKFTYFPYLGEKWVKNCEEERLLGVSMTGIFDNALTSGKQSPTKLILLLKKLKQHTEEINKEWAAKIGINPSKSITCVKPEGTTSCLAGCASGLHPQYAPYFIRRVRIDKKDPVYQLMKDQGVPCEDCVINPDNQAVFSFPMKSSNPLITSTNLDAITHMILWKIYQDFYCHHKPSVTVNYSDSEFLMLGQWVYEYFDGISGVSFLPKTEHTYQQAPFEEITEEVYNNFPRVDVDFSLLRKYEQQDTTTSSHSFACTANGCELVDLTTG